MDEIFQQRPLQILRDARHKKLYNDVKVKKYSNARSVTNWYQQRTSSTMRWSNLEHFTNKPELTR